MAVDARDKRVAAGDDKRLRKDFGPIGLLFTAVGSIIGSGWLFGALNASQMAGPASMLSWAIGMVMFVLIGLTFSELGTMFPHSGGVARYPQYSHGSFASFGIGWITWVAAASVAPIEVLACVQYSQSYLPIKLQIEVEGAAVLTGPGIVVAILLMAVFVGVNFFGVRWFARINNVLVWWKLAVLVLVIVAFFAVSFNPGHFSDYGFAPNGADGIFGAVASAGVAFAYLGFRQGVELAGETKNPKRNVPLTVIGSVVLCGILYILLQAAFIGSAPTQAIAKGGWAHVGENFTSGTETLALFGPLAAIAGSVLGMTWLAWILYIDAVISPGDTGLIYAGVTARLSYAMGRNRNAPRGLSKVNRHGVPWVSLILAWAIGCLFFLPFPGWQQLVGFVTTATVMSFGAGPLVLVSLRKAMPERHRPFKLPGGWVIAFLALWSANLIVYWSGWEQNRLLFIGILIGFALFFVNQLVAKDKAPPIDFKHGWWLLVWLAGLALISFLGGFGAAEDSAKSVGNLQLFDLVGGFVATFILAAVAFVLAVWCRLPQQRVAEIVDAHGLDEEEEELKGAPEA